MAETARSRGGTLDAWRARLATITGLIDTMFAAITILLLSFIVCANGLEILRRGLFNQSFLWLYEINLLSCTWMYFLGMEMVYYRNRDITIDFMLMLLRGRGASRYAVVVNLVGIATFAVVLRYTIALIVLQWPFRTTGIGLPNALFTLPLAMACASFVLILIRQSLDLWATGTVPPPHGAPAEVE